MNVGLSTNEAFHVLYRLCAVIVILPTSKSPLRNESTYNNVPPYMPGGSNLVYVAAAWDEGEINASRVPSVFTVGNSSQDTYTVQVYGRSTTYTNVRLSPDTDYTILVRYDIDNDNIGGTEVSSMLCVCTVCS